MIKMPVDLGIALMPDDEVKGLTVDLHQALRREHRTSYLLGVQCHPHLSLYQSTFANYQTLEQAMQQLTDKERKVKEATIKLKTVTMFPSGYVTLQCDNSTGLQRLHRDVLSLASRVRLTDVPTIWERNNVLFPPEKRENIETYGYPDALDLYDPRFTIGRVIDEGADRVKIVSELGEIAKPFLDYSFSPKELVVYELGVDAACVNPKKI